MRRIGHDVESFTNYFCVGIQDYDNESKELFEISEVRNDLDNIYNFYTNYTGDIVSFNGVHYDSPVIKYIIVNYESLRKLNVASITARIKMFSDKIIEDEYHDEVRKIKYIKDKWTEIDLFLYWSKGIRLSWKISLKSLGIQLGYPVVQELPFSPSHILAVDELPVLREYNMTHDLGILKLLYDKMKKEVDLREYIRDSLGIQCMSMDAPKIASQVLLKDYCRIRKLNPYHVEKWRFERNIIHIKNVLVGFDPYFETDIFKNMFERWKNSYDKISEEFIFSLNETELTLTYGIGGLHSVNKNEKYYSSVTHIVKTSDVASLYPNLIINYKCIRFPEVLEKYKNVKDERIIAKQNKEKTKDALFKLILNSISGLLDSDVFWLYFPEGALRMRLIGQLILTKHIEVCALRGWKVVSANTDGIEVVIPLEDEEEYEKVMDETIKLFNMELEHERYDFINYLNVNSYIAKVEDKAKEKGMFVTDPVLGKSVDTLVIPKALKLYFMEGISFEESIRNPEKYGFHIYDYCKSNKVGKDFTVIWNGEIQQRLNRYYFSKGAPFIFKKKIQEDSIETLIHKRAERIMLNDPYITEKSALETAKAILKDGLQHMNVGWGVKLFNTYEDKKFEEYEINYDYYIKQCRDIVDTLNNYNQLTLW